MLLVVLIVVLATSHSPHSLAGPGASHSLASPGASHSEPGSASPKPSPSFSFKEDFSSTKNNWTVNGVEASGQYRNGKYQINLKAASGGALTSGLASPAHVSDLNPSLPNIIMATSGRSLTTYYGSDYGFFCGADSDTDFYEFVIGTNVGATPEADIYKFGAFADLASTKISVDLNATNQLQAACITASSQGAIRLEFWVNGKKVLSATDRNSPYTISAIGLYADTFSVPESFEFDKFVVTQH